MESQHLPFVSAIVPVLNDAGRIGACIEALLAQEYPRDRYEIIVVDNGSADGSYEIAARYPVTALRELDVRSSFAARNKGIGLARGTIYAFTDSDCAPDRRWIAEGVRALEGGADLAGGNVRFVFSPRPSAAEVYDSITNMQNRRSIAERGVCKTANLFARASVFAAVGPFPHDLPSGGDVIWTGRATAAGHRIVYNHNAEVAHPTRRLPALLKKHFRVGRGHHAIRAEQRLRAANGTLSAPSAPSAPSASSAPSADPKRGKLAKARRALRGFLPEPLAEVRASLRRGGVEGAVGLYRVWLVIWMCRVATTLGNLAAALEVKGKGRQIYATR